MEMTWPDVNRILVHEDVEGLIQAGAPLDEYADEAAQIAAALSLSDRERLTEENVLSTVGMVWLKSFELSPEEMALRMPAVRRVTERIMALKHS
jgi:hypothetical protein